MGRNTNQVITFNDAIYMRDNEGYTQKQAIPVSSQVMTKTEIEAYLYVDNSLFSAYSASRAVPYQKIAVGTPPDGEAPTYKSQLTISGFDTSSVDLAWGSQDNTAVTAQTVYYRVSGGSWNTITIGALAFTYTVSGLAEGTTYEFYIRACDAANNCTNSVTQTQTTAVSATLSISPTSYTAGAFGENVFINITTTAAWTLTDNASWLTPDATSGTGNAVVRVVVARNFGGFRLGQVAVSITGDTKYCNISQDAS